MSHVTHSESDIALSSRLFLYIMLGCAAFVGGVILLMNFMPAN